MSILLSIVKWWVEFIFCMFEEHYKKMCIYKYAVFQTLSFVYLIKLLKILNNYNFFFVKRTVSFQIWFVSESILLSPCFWLMCEKLYNCIFFFLILLFTLNEWFCKFIFPFFLYSLNFGKVRGMSSIGNWIVELSRLFHV